MITQVIKISDPDIEQKQVQMAANVILNGGLVVIPTETVYGLGGNGLDAESARKIYAAKGRPSDNPLIIHISSPEEAELYAYTCDEYYKLAHAFMPGPLTVILKKKSVIPYEVSGGLNTVALRCPSNKIANSIIKAAGVPIAAPSANLSGSPSPTCAEHVKNDLLGRVDLIVDGGECDIGLESTIVSIDQIGRLTLLRPGAVTYDALCCVCDSVYISPSMEGVLSADEHPVSPGMKYKHYAPSAPFVLLDGDEKKIIDFLLFEQKEKRCAILCYDEEIEYLSSSLLLPVGKRDDTEEQARRLFSLLRKADLYHADIIYAHMPDKHGIGMALYNRMIRAAAHTVKEIH